MKQHLSCKQRIEAARKKRKFMNRLHWTQASEIRNEIHLINSKLQNKKSLRELKQIHGIYKKRMSISNLKNILQYQREELLLQAKA